MYIGCFGAKAINFVSVLGSTLVKYLSFIPEH